MFQEILKKLEGREALNSSAMEESMNAILSGNISEADSIRFLTLLRDKGETVEEIKGAVLAIRSKATNLSLKNKEVIDVCGTGGDGKNTFNISTAVAFVLAGAGIVVAKHGNRAVSSQSGSSDVLKAIGVNIDASPELVARCIDEIGVGFLFAPLYHSALKTVAEARKKIGTRTLFNIIGPMLNPAGAKKQVIGVYENRLRPLVAQVLKELGSQTVAVVHGADGLDEVTLAGKTNITFLKNGQITEEIFDPKSVGYDLCKSEDLVGGDSATNAKRLKKVLKGHSEPIDHCVHLNAALALRVAGKTDDWREALLIVQESISSGRAYEKLEELIEMTNS